MEVLHKLVLSFWVCVARHAKSTQNKTLHIFTISPKNMRDKVDILSADKHESFLQDSIFFGVRSQAFPKYPKQQVCKIFAISQGKREG